MRRQEMLIKNREIMEKVLREKDQIKNKKKILQDPNKSEYKMRIAREKLEANMYSKVI